MALHAYASASGKSPSENPSFDSKAEGEQEDNVIARQYYMYTILGKH